MEAAAVLKRLNLIPRRTIRVVLWTNEENGLRGARAYVERHKDHLSRHVAAIEADSGVFQPLGYAVGFREEDKPTKEPRALEQLTQLAKLLEPLGATQVRAGGGGADIGPMREYGVPLLGHRVDMTHYFDYHHTHADTLDKVDPQDLDKNVATLAIAAYVLADMPGRLGEP
jgi:Zn-dependent M28 family amino/carboxypeptidase